MIRCFCVLSGAVISFNEDSFLSPFDSGKPIPPITTPKSSKQPHNTSKQQSSLSSGSLLRATTLHSKQDGRSSEQRKAGSQKSSNVSSQKSLGMSGRTLLKREATPTVEESEVFFLKIFHGTLIFMRCLVSSFERMSVMRFTLTCC